MPSRAHPLENAVQITHDAEALEARAGESLAHALLAADRLVLTRSPKLHRPRGPYCLRAACEGCLVRVNGVPNVMACRHRVRGGERVETQNVVGSRELDLLAATDFMFPHGLDHHRLFAGVRGVSVVLTRLARRIAGLGTLPDAPREIRPSEVAEVAVLVVGGGRAGLAVASELGSLATLVDDGLELGGALGVLDPTDASSLIQRARASGAVLVPRTTAAGIFAGPDFQEIGAAAPGSSELAADERAGTAPSARLSVLLAGEGSARVVFARAVVLATGEHDPTPDFRGNDLPGTLSARAGLALVRAGIVPDERTAVIGAGRFAERAAVELGARVSLRAAASNVVRAEGRLRLRSVVFRDGNEERTVQAGALLYDGPASPAHELAVQAGARVRFDAIRGYVLALDRGGRVAPNVWCAGSVTGGSGVTVAPEGVAHAVREAINAR